MVPSRHLRRLPKKPPVRRIANQIAHTAFLHLCTARAPSHLSILLPVHASSLPLLRRVRPRLHTTHPPHSYPAPPRRFFQSHSVSRIQRHHKLSSQRRELLRMEMITQERRSRKANYLRSVRWNVRRSCSSVASVIVSGDTRTSTIFVRPYLV